MEGVIVLHTTEREGWVWLSVDGALHHDTAAELQRRLDALADEGRVRVVLDVQPGATVDFDALVALVLSRNRLRREGGDLLLRVPSGDVNRLLELTGLTDLIEVV
jgi:anti-sigma B factor antagonist